MLAFTLRRAIQAIGVMIAVGIISFSMFRFAGDPVNQIVSQDTSAAEREVIRTSLGLDDPVLEVKARRPHRVVGALDTPVPYSPPLEEFYLPGEAQIERAARLLASY